METLITNVEMPFFVLVFILVTLNILMKRFPKFKHFWETFGKRIGFEIDENESEENPS